MLSLKYNVMCDQFVHVRGCHFKGLAPLKTLNDRQKSAPTTQPVSKALGTLQTNYVGKVMGLFHLLCNMTF